MNPYMRYQNTAPDTGWTRMDLLLALYDKALERLDKADAAFKANNPVAAGTQLLKVQQIVMALAEGVRVDVNPEVNTKILGFYQFAVTKLSQPSVANIGNVRKVLQTLRASFEAVRAEANELERTGKLAAAHTGSVVVETA